MMDFQSVILWTDWKSILRRITEIGSGQIINDIFSEAEVVESLDTQSD